MSNEDSLSLGDVVQDLVRIIGTVEEQVSQAGSSSYETVQREVSGVIRLHLLSYVRFLEGQNLLSYDRISDEMRISDVGRQAQADPALLQEAAREAFGEQLTAEENLAEEHLAVEDLGLEGAFDEMFDAMEDSVEPGDQLSMEEESSEPYVAPPVEEEAPMKEEAPAFAAPVEEQREPAPVQVAPTQQRQESSAMAYERNEEIGSGGIGTVYLGRQVRLDRAVAIKEIQEIFNVFAGVQREDILHRFRSIITTQAALMHPNIIQIIDVDTSGEYPFSVMAYAPNGNLRGVIEAGERPPLEVSLKYFLQILHALNAAHDQGVVHGSLKPENVVLDQAGNALLTDFGISKIVERDGARGNQVYVGVGSVAYMSPEQFQDPNLATVKSDIYSLGIMLYEMLTGKVPGRRSPMPSSFFPDVPRALDDIFDKMCMDREEDRYDSVADVIKEIYTEPEVLSILDKRSGVLFLRDPRKFGASGLGQDVTFAPLEDDDEAAAASYAEEAFEESEVAWEAPSADIGEETFVANDEGPGQESEAEEHGGEEAAEVEGGDEMGVLDKLDKYGALFEED